ncbi:MAG: PD40 domain-containing protein [Ardenticatenaceae bacterium]|nr:PD40 domain-containing protein [Ardenticatenaceae bacterium]MCB9444198.1 PD40 domain-containing protein [Ardenticatenaceae bacterium]
MSHKLCLLLTALLLLAACTPSAVEPSLQMEQGYPAPSQLSEVLGYPPPPTLKPPPTLPEPTQIVLEPGEIYDAHETPFPTFTPRPTPTRKPGPTATSIPLPEPAGSPAGTLWYATMSDYYTLSFDMFGQVEEEPNLAPLPTTLEFKPYRVFPSPNGNYLVLMRPVEPGGLPLIVNRITGQSKALFESYSGGSFFGWHPDGRHFWFWIDSIGMWSVDAETYEITTLALPQGPVQGAAISPDGQTIAYIDQNLPDTLGAMWFVSSAGSDAEPQFDAGNVSYLYPNAWSPDGSSIVYYGNCSEPLPKGESSLGGPLCTFDLHSQRCSALKIPFTGFTPAWSPNSRYIAATGLTKGEIPCDPNTSSSEWNDCLYKAQSIYIADVSTGESYQLTTGIAPVWSPDGSTIVFLSNRSGTSEVWSIDIISLSFQQLTTDGQPKNPYGQLFWLPEGEE